MKEGKNKNFVYFLSTPPPGRGGGSGGKGARFRAGA
jgi:hypothetical protein